MSPDAQQRADGVTMTTAQIGRAGELLVQCRLLLLGLDSSAMSTDAGIDLVVYLPTSRRALTVQVKANAKPKPGGGKGRMALDWWVPVDSPADLQALVDLSTLRIWMFTTPELATLAQQNSSGRHHLYMYTDPGIRRRVTARAICDFEFEPYLAERRAPELLDVSPQAFAAGSRAVGQSPSGTLESSA